jgi:hypothetical protein
MRQRERENHALHAEDFGTATFWFPFVVASFLKDLIQSTHLLGCFKR